MSSSYPTTLRKVIHPVWKEKFACQYFGNSGNFGGFFAIVENGLFASPSCRHLSDQSECERNAHIQTCSIMPIADCSISAETHDIKVFRYQQRILVKNTGSDNLMLGEAVYVTTPRPADKEIQNTFFGYNSECGLLMATISAQTANNIHVETLTDTLLTYQQDNVSDYRYKTSLSALAYIIDSLMSKHVMRYIKGKINADFVEAECLGNLANYINSDLGNDTNLRDTDVELAQAEMCNIFRNMSYICHTQFPTKVGYVNSTPPHQNYVKPGDTFEISLC